MVSGTRPESLVDPGRVRDRAFFGRGNPPRGSPRVIRAESYLSSMYHRRFAAFPRSEDRQSAYTIPADHATPRTVTTRETPGGDTSLNRQLAVLYCQRLLWLSTRVIEKIVGLFALSAGGLVSFG